MLIQLLLHHCTITSMTRMENEVKIAEFQWGQNSRLTCRNFMVATVLLALPSSSLVNRISVLSFSSPGLSCCSVLLSLLASLPINTFLRPSGLHVIEMFCMLVCMHQIFGTSMTTRSVMFHSLFACARFTVWTEVVVLELQPLQRHEVNLHSPSILIVNSPV